MRNRSLLVRASLALSLMASTMAVALGVGVQPASAAAPSVDLWAPATINISIENGGQNAIPNHIYAMAIVRHDAGTNVNGVRFDLVHATSGGNYGGGNCGTTAFITCSGSYVGSGGWNNVGGRATNAALTVRELPGQAAATTNTNSNYSQVWVDITPPNFDSWQNDGPDGGNNGICGIESGTRMCKNTASFSFRLSDGQTTADQTMVYYGVGESNSSGQEDYPTAYGSSSTNQASVTAGAQGAVTIAYGCDDNDSGSPAVCDNALIRYRRLGDNALVNPGATSDSSGPLTCSLAASGPGCETRTDNSNHVNGWFNADDNTDRSYTYRAPRSRGLYVIEAQFCNENGTCPSNGTYNETQSTYGQSGSMWQTLGSFYVNDAAPTVSYATTTQTGGSNVAAHPTTGALHPNTGTTLGLTATTSADTQIVDWNLDQNGTNGINSSGYEVRTYGTVSYSSSAGTPTVTKTASLNLSGYGSGVSCSTGVRVYDTGAVNATDITASSATASQSCTTNNIPTGTAQSGVNVQRGTATSINLAAGDADRWSAGGNGGDEAPTISITQPAVGTVTCGAFTPSSTTAGSFACSYSVPANTTPGAYSYSYTVTDSHAGTSSSTSVAGSILNTAPTATGSTRTIQRGTSSVFNLNGTDPVNGDTITGSLANTGYATVSTAGMPSGSSTTCTAAGACTVSIAAGTTTGNYSFTWNVKDNANTSSTATETVTVANTAPAANAVTVNNVQRGRPAGEAAFNLNATDAVNGDPLTYSVVSSAGLPGGSSLSCSTAGACTVAVPANTALGNYSFTYKANDNNLDSNTATATVGVGNTTPVANNVGPLHTTVGANLGVTLNGTDFNGDTLTYTAPVASPTKGNVTGSGSSRSYVASNGTKGNDSFTYTASDNAPSTSAAGTVSITIDNTAPTASGQTTSAPRQIATGITLSGADVNADSLTYAVQANATKGVLSCNTAGSCTYTADPGTSGDDTFTFVTNDGTANSAAATVTVHITNNAPTATARTADAPRRVATAISVAGTDPNGDALTVSGPTTGPSKGSASCTSVGVCTYTSGAGQTGTDSFTFTVDDGFGGTNTGSVTVTLTNSDPVAAAQTVTAVRHATTGITLGATDPNLDDVDFAYTPASKGTLTCDAAGSCNYRSNIGESGTDSFTFVASDAYGGSSSATVTINLQNTDPVAADQAVDVPRRIPTAISLGATDDNGDALSVTAPLSGPSKGDLDCTGPSCTYLSHVGATGTDSFTFSVDDGFGGTDAATVSITLTNSDPTANPQATSAAVHVATPVTLTGTDPNGDTLSYDVTVQPTKGSVTCSVGGACSYQSNVGATGSDSFTFSADDGFGRTDTAVVDITLSNTKPVADPQNVTAPRATPTLITLTGSDPNDDTLSFQAPLSGPSKGTLDCSGPACIYTSNAGETGSDSFTFRVDDGNGETDTATISIDLANTAPIGTPASVTVTKGTSKTFDLHAFDPNGDTVSYAITGLPAQGSVSCTGPGNATCTFAATGDVGPDSLSFTATDGFGATSVPATVSITVGAVKVSIGDSQAMEPDAGTTGGVYVPVTLSAPLSTDVTISYYTQDITATGGVTSGDYRIWGTPSTPRTLVIKAGTTWNAVSPPTFGDNASEPDEEFRVHISGVSGGGSQAVIGDGAGTVTIVDGVAPGGDPVLAIPNPTMYESDNDAGQKAQFTIGFSKALAAPTTIQLIWANGTALRGLKGSGADWAPPIATSLIIPAGTAQAKTIDFLIWGDGQVEPDETMSLTVVPPSGAPIIQRKPSATMTILNDD